MKPFVLFLSLIFFATLAEARKFDFKNESFATYVKGTYGTSEVLGTPFNESSGTQTAGFTELIRSTASGEFGFLLAGDTVTFRVGAELLMPQHRSDTKGYDAGSQEIFNLETNISALTPMAYLDFNFMKSGSSKAFIGAGVGYSFVKMENIYTFTAGRSTYGSMNDFFERATANAIATHGYIGYEMLFSDNVTVVFDAGYKYLPVRKLNHQNATTTFQGAVNKGDPVLNDAGSNRLVNLSSAYAGMAFRFYIGL
jgi:opacity protein-like surface antigen